METPCPAGGRQVSDLMWPHGRCFVKVVYATDETTHHYAALYRQLRQQRTPIPTNDLWIAALVTEHGASLYTRDAHFEHLAQLDLV